MFYKRKDEFAKPRQFKRGGGVILDQERWLSTTEQLIHATKKSSSILATIPDVAVQNLKQGLKIVREINDNITKVSKDEDEAEIDEDFIDDGLSVNETGITCGPVSVNRKSLLDALKEHEKKTMNDQAITDFEQTTKCEINQMIPELNGQEDDVKENVINTTRSSTTLRNAAMTGCSELVSKYEFWKSAVDGTCFFDSFNICLKKYYNVHMPCEKLMLLSGHMFKAFHPDSEYVKQCLQVKCFKTVDDMIRSYEKCDVQGDIQYDGLMLCMLFNVNLIIIEAADGHYNCYYIRGIDGTIDDISFDDVLENVEAMVILNYQHHFSPLISRNVEAQQFDFCSNIEAIRFDDRIITDMNYYPEVYLNSEFYQSLTLRQRQAKQMSHAYKPRRCMVIANSIYRNFHELILSGDQTVRDLRNKDDVLVYEQTRWNQLFKLPTLIATACRASSSLQYIDDQVHKRFESTYHTMREGIRMVSSLFKVEKGKYRYEAYLEYYMPHYDYLLTLRNEDTNDRIKDEDGESNDDEDGMESVSSFNDVNEQDSDNSNESDVNQIDLYQELYDILYSDVPTTDDRFEPLSLNYDINPDFKKKSPKRSTATISNNMMSILDNLTSVVDVLPMTVDLFSLITNNMDAYSKVDSPSMVFARSLADYIRSDVLIRFLDHNEYVHVVCNEAATLKMYLVSFKAGLLAEVEVHSTGSFPMNKSYNYNHDLVEANSLKNMIVYEYKQSNDVWMMTSYTHKGYYVHKGECDPKLTRQQIASSRPNYPDSVSQSDVIRPKQRQVVMMYDNAGHKILNYDDMLRDVTCSTNGESSPLHNLPIKRNLFTEVPSNVSTHYRGYLRISEAQYVIIFSHLRIDDSTASGVSSVGFTLVYYDTIMKGSVVQPILPRIVYSLKKGIYTLEANANGGRIILSFADAIQMHLTKLLGSGRKLRDYTPYHDVIQTIEHVSLITTPYMLSSLSVRKCSMTGEVVSFTTQCGGTLGFKVMGEVLHLGCGIKVDHTTPDLHKHSCVLKYYRSMKPDNRYPGFKCKKCGQVYAYNFCAERCSC